MSLTEPHDDRTRPHDDTARQTARERQSLADRSTIKVKLIENGILVNAGAGGWFTFQNWDGKGGAAEHIAARIESLKKDRAAMPRSNC